MSKAQPVFTPQDVRHRVVTIEKPWYEHLMPGIYHQLKTVIVGEVTITPEAAAKILQEHNRPEGNRKISVTQLRLLSHSMEAGDYILTGETIIFDQHGNVINGQHRLTACVDSGNAIPALVVIGVSDQAFMVLDQHAKRTIGQVLGMLNSPTPNELGAAISTLFSFLTTGVLNKSHWRITVNDSLRLLQEHPRLQDSVAFALSYRKGCRIFGSSSIPVVSHYVFRHADPVLADEFFSALLDFKIPDGTKWQGPHLLLKRLSTDSLDSKSRLHPRIVSGLLVKAWNCFYENRPCRVLRISMDDDYPFVAGLDYTHNGKPILTAKNENGATANGQRH